MIPLILDILKDIRNMLQRIGTKTCQKEFNDNRCKDCDYYLECNDIYKMTEKINLLTKSLSLWEDNALKIEKEKKKTKRRKK
jgi:hypothetical protein